MAAHLAAGTLFAWLLALNREACDAGTSSSAYHILAGALHEAQARQHASGPSLTPRLM